MGSELTILEFKNGEAKVLSKIDFGRVVIGREPDDSNGIKISSSAVSRNHGEFKAADKLWLYEDLGSTNGTWINGIALEKNLPYVIAHGDVLQLADAVIHIRGNPTTNPILVVFNGQDLIGTHEIPAFGKALVFGGNEATYEVNSTSDTPSLVFEKRGQNIAAFQVNKDISVLLHGELVTQSKFIEDRDEIRIENYRILLLNPSKEAAALMADKSLPSWEPEPNTGGLKIPSSSNFGKREEEFKTTETPGATGTIAINPQELSEYSKIYQPSLSKPSPAQHYTRGSEGMRRPSPRGEGFTGIEKALIAFIIITFVISLVLLVGFFIK